MAAGCFRLLTSGCDFLNRRLYSYRHGPQFALLLQALPVDKLKISHSIIDGISNDSDDQVISSLAAELHLIWPPNRIEPDQMFTSYLTDSSAPCTSRHTKFGSKITAI